MFVFPCLYDPNQHQIIHPELGEWVKRQVAPADKERFFVYFHKIHKTFVIARWAQDKFGVFTDFLNLGHSLANFTREKAQELRERLYAPVGVQAMQKAVAQATRDQVTENTEKGAYMEDYMKRKRQSAGALK